MVSLLPDHLAARFPGTLSEIEQVVATVEQAKSVEAGADLLRRDAVTLPSAIRWVRRRLRLVRALLTIVVGLLPQSLLGCAPTVAAVRSRWACPQVLVALRERVSAHLQALARPLGFRHPLYPAGEHPSGLQQHMGPDPPP
jgi:hypothetical protein